MAATAALFTLPRRVSTQGPEPDLPCCKFTINNSSGHGSFENSLDFDEKNAPLKNSASAHLKGSLNIETVFNI